MKVHLLIQLLLRFVLQVLNLLSVLHSGGCGRTLQAQTFKARLFHRHGEQRVICMKEAKLPVLHAGGCGRTLQAQTFKARLFDRHGEQRVIA
jgi:hypothetical protein